MGEMRTFQTHRLPRQAGLTPEMQATPIPIFDQDGVGGAPDFGDRRFGLIAKATRSLAGAETLAHAGSPDFAVSRAYFAMYYAATALLLCRGITVHKHGALILALSREFVETGVLPADFCRWLIDANDARLIADYGDGERLSPRQTTTHLERSRRFVAAARTIIGAGGQTLGRHTPD